MDENQEFENQENQNVQNANDKVAHIAGKAVATYYGGALGNRAYSALSKTGLGKKLEHNVGNKIAKAPIANEVNKKLDDEGVLDLADSAADRIGKKGKSGASSNVNNTSTGKKSNLGNSVNKNGNKSSINNNGSKFPLKRNNNSSNLTPRKQDDDSSLPRALQNKNHNQGLSNRYSNNYSTNEDVENEEANEEFDDIEDSSTKTKLLEKQKLLILKRMAPMLIIAAVIVFIIMAVVVIITIPSNVYESFGGVVIENPDEQFTINNETNPELLKAEQEYQAKLNETVQKYQDDYGVTLDKYLLHATIAYKYFATSTNNMFTDSEISDSDITIEDNNSESSSENNQEETTIEYTAATKKIETVAKLMVEKNGDVYLTNFEREGTFYNNLVNSRFLETYYKDFLQNNEIETKKKLVDEIFDYSDLAKEIFKKPLNNAFVSDQIVVHLQTCEVIPYRKTQINNINIFNNPSAGNETYTDSIDMLNYIKGVVYGEIRGSIDEKNREGLKAFMIASLTYIIGDSRAGFDLKSGEMYFPAGNCRQLCCNPILGCTYSYNGNKYGTSYVGPERYSDRRFSLGAMPAEDTQLLDEILNEIFGYVMVKKGITADTFVGSDSIPDHAGSYLNECSPGTCFSQVDAMKDAQAGMTYTEILNKYYSKIEFDLINIKEGLYYTTGANGEYNGEVTYYRQGDYKSVTFCGRSGRSISSSGCGVTSAAIVASSFTGNKMYDPVYMMKMAHSGGYCGSGISGTSASFFKHFANKMGFGYVKYTNRQTNELIQTLSKGNAMVIAHMGPGHFTSGGHYIVLSGVNSQGQVMVYDPANPKRNKYWDVNLVADELKSGFYVIIKE